jgi:hypothetical protein
MHFRYFINHTLKSNTTSYENSIPQSKYITPNLNYLAFVRNYNLVEVIQITKSKHVDHIATFTCLHRRSIKMSYALFGGKPPDYKQPSIPTQSYRQIQE